MNFKNGIRIDRYPHEIKRDKPFYVKISGPHFYCISFKKPSNKPRKISPILTICASEYYKVIVLEDSLWKNILKLIKLKYPKFFKKKQSGRK